MLTADLNISIVSLNSFTHLVYAIRTEKKDLHNRLHRAKNLRSANYFTFLCPAYQHPIAQYRRKFLNYAGRISIPLYAMKRFWLKVSSLLLLLLGNQEKGHPAEAIFDR